jgi:hypothetical protein
MKNKNCLVNFDFYTYLYIIFTFFLIMVNFDLALKDSGRIRKRY